MKNTKYFPFERNNYFYGKLLSVDDFKLEQKYGNDKRRMLSRYLYGAGVVTGMNVVAVDDTTILIENGLALDYSGREIVVDESVVHKLSTLEGFSDYEEDRNTGYLYLCIAYEEEEAQVIHSISHSGQKGSEAFNKIREGYRLYLTRNEPESENLSSSSLYETSHTVYWGKGIRVRQTMPRFARSNSVAELKIEVENMGQQEHFAFSYELDLTCLSYQGRSHMTVSFDELLFEKAGRYTFTYLLDTLGVKETQASAVLTEGSFRLRIHQTQTDEKAQVKSVVQINPTDEKEEVRKLYREQGMNQILQDGSNQEIYLAKISLLRAGDSVVINEIDKMPFGQYAASSYLEEALLHMAEKGGFGRTGLNEKETELHGNGRGENFSIGIAEGVEELSFAGGAAKGTRIFSREISHGLGIGKTTIILSIEGEETREVLFGTPGIFQNDLPNIEVAAKSDFQRGTFIIGIQLTATTVQEKVRIHWTAIRDRREILEEKKERRIFIRPNVLNLNIRESYYLEAVCSNMTDTTLIWQVKDNGGTINENGMYTAPNTAGVYEVTAVSAAYPEVKASIFVIVREKGA